MSFVAGKSTFVRFWLFATFVGLSNAQDVASNAARGDFNFPTYCGEGRFECQNKECIQSELLCDGKADCLDSSDETEFECSKPELTCPDYAFRCKYGACIDKDLTCNGFNDCVADGSDEDTSDVCRVDNILADKGQGFPSGGIAPVAGAVPSNGYGGFAGGSASGGGEYHRPLPMDYPCLLPLRPTNGQFKLRRLSEHDDFEYINPPGPFLKINSHLVYTCDPGYKIRGNPLVSCSLKGKWSRKPVCIEIRCRPLSSVSTMGNCTHASGRVKPCSDNEPVHPKTKAELSCRPGYREEFSSSKTQTVECNNNGKWEPEPIRCVPVCGKVKSPQNLIATNEEMTSIDTLPWHAALYTQGSTSNSSESVFRCDVTIIQAKLLLTTAHCVYDFIISWEPAFGNSTKPLDILDSFFITVENLGQDSLLNASQVNTKHKVKNVHTTCNFQDVTNIYARDVALIELYEPLEFSDVLLPVCLDELGSIQNILETGAYEEVSRSHGSSTSDETQIKTMSDLPRNQCVTLYNATQSPYYVNDDQFCEIHNSGTDSCVKDVFNDGGGLVFEMNNVWYLMGIVSQISSLDMDDGEKSCDRNVKLVYNKVSKHMTWIQQVVSNLERFKYPPCSRYLPPFHTRPTTPTPEITSTNSPTTSMIQTYVDARFKADSCLAPPHPGNGTRRLHPDFCARDLDCWIVEGAPLGLGSQLIYDCNLGFRIEGNTDVYCKANGYWSPIPVCIEITCIPLESIRMIATCSHFGMRVDCSYPVFPGTQARVSCRSGYRITTSQTTRLLCSGTGNWDPEIPRCASVCGGEVSSQGLPVTNPWHATLYTEKYSSTSVVKEVQCGATLIQSNLLLTAAHCVYNDELKTTEDPEKLFILMSSINRHYDSPLHDFHYVRRSTVKNVHVHCSYRGAEGNYTADIALLELQEPFEFFNVQLHPACLDFSGHYVQFLKPGAQGLFLGYGKTAMGGPSDFLESIGVPFVSQAECKNSSVTSGRQAFVSNDKFCGGFNNGTAVCLGNGGGGLIVKINNLWFLVGVASVDLSADSNDDENFCDGKAHMLYTKVADYMAWILDVMFNLERYKSYPQCNSDFI